MIHYIYKCLNKTVRWETHSVALKWKKNCSSWRIIRKFNFTSLGLPKEPNSVFNIPVCLQQPGKKLTDTVIAETRPPVSEEDQFGFQEKSYYFQISATLVHKISNSRSCLGITKLNDVLQVENSWWRTLWKRPSFFGSWNFKFKNRNQS